MPHSTDSQPTTGNPAAERPEYEAAISAAWAAMRNDVLNPDGPPFPAPVADLFRAGRNSVDAAYRAALLHERRATVDPERLALALRAVYGHYESSIGVALIRAQDVIRQYEALDATASEEEEEATHNPLRNPLLCDRCGHHIHRSDPCGWTFGAGRFQRPCPCATASEEEARHGS